MKRPNLEASSSGRSFLVSLLGGLTLLALATTVFAVSTQARSVSTQAEQSVRVIENLRVVSIARAELSIASRLAAVSPDQTEVLRGTLENATVALDAVETNFDDNTTPEILSAFAAYRIATEDQSALISDGQGSGDPALAAEIATGDAFQTLSDELRTEQVATLDRLRAANDLMNVIGTIATFVVAFVVPSAALYIFEALRRNPRRARALELEYDRASTTSLAMAAAVAKETAHLRRTLDALPPEVDRDNLRRSVLRFEHVAALNGAVRTLHNVDVAVDDLCISVSHNISEFITVDTSHADSAVVHGDRDQITLIVFELLHNAVTHGATPIRLEVASDPHMVAVSVIDHGNGLPDVIEDGIIHDNEYAARGNLMSGAYGFGLLATREAAESLGGRLRYHRDGEETTLIVELPRSQSAAPPAPIDTSLPAALASRKAA